VLITLFLFLNMRTKSKSKITVQGCFWAFVTVFLIAGIPSCFEDSEQAVNSLGPQPLEVSSAQVKSDTKPSVTIGMSKSSADAAVNGFISQYGGSYSCDSFPEDPNYQICIYQGNGNLEFHTEYGSVVKVF
jgi:hypothetical protein